MSASSRLPTGGEIDRALPLAFRFDGTPYQGFAGDTIASALLGAGVRLIGRSFKYHRPRGLLAASHEEPNAILDLRHGAHHDPNARATLEPLVDGVELRSVHARGSAARDTLGFLDRAWRFMPAAFYYKTFLWPRWHLFEPSIRALAGLGRIDAAARAHGAPTRHANVDLCVIGAGSAGLAAARAGIAQGRSVLLVEQRSRVGGALLWRSATIEGQDGAAWAGATAQLLCANGAEVLTRTTALGLYDHNALVLVQRGIGTGNGERIWQVRAREIVLASGAVERPLLFGDNDRPGVMLADAVLEYLRRYAVRAGRRVVIATGNDTAHEVALALHEAGAECVVVDSREPGRAAHALLERGIELRSRARVVRALGRRGVEGVALDSGERIEADLVAMAGGWTPLIHLYCHARGRPRWDPARGAMLPGEPVDGLRIAGLANGARSLGEALAQGWIAGGGAAQDAPQAAACAFDWGSAPDTAALAGGRRVWIDLQHDVTAKDIELAVRENFTAVEHLKRYTTLGMATDQGKTSNINGLAILAERTGRAIAEVGITTFRPPFVPVSMATVAGVERGELQAPLRRLPAENAHRAEGATLVEYGDLLRPAWYGAANDAIERECRAARTDVVVLDGSSLGKIEILGPQAAALLDFVFYTRMSTLAPGRLRYGLALTEGGAILDDGVVLRVADRHFVLSCSSSHVATMRAQLEAWREDRFDLAQVFVHDASAHWATLAISGPRSKCVLEALDLGIALDDAAFPHMSARLGSFESRAARIARVSFTGERCYEVSVPACLAQALWERVRGLGAMPLGVEALGVLRAEKGFIFVGQDTDSETMPHDIGMGSAREQRSDAYVGDRSLFTPEARRSDRRQLVGIASSSDEPLAPGAHAVAASGARLRSIGFVTSSHYSHALGRPIALALIENGRQRTGETLELEALGVRARGTVCAPCFLDPQGARLHA